GLPSSDGGQEAIAVVGRLVLPVEACTQVNGCAAAGGDVEGDLVDDRLHDQDAAAVLDVGRGIPLRDRRQAQALVDDPQIAPAVADGGGDLVAVGGAAVPYGVAARLGGRQQDVGHAFLRDAEGTQGVTQNPADHG